MRVGSLFAGIGGFDLGFERAGYEIKWQVEIDDYCRRVLERHFPRAERFGDIRECGSHNLKPVDVICGGFPCQDISSAGRGAGIENGERSGLWREMRRVICELRPRFVVVENVAALLGRDLGRVVGDLAEGGYDAEWDVLPACAFGAPHIRERVWIIGYSNYDGIRRDDGRLPATEGRKFRHKSLRRAEGLGSDVAHSAKQRLQFRKQVGQPENAEEIPGGMEPQPERRSSLGFASQWWAVEPNMGRVAHGIPRRVDRLKGLGNAVVPQIAEWIAQRIKEVSHHVSG